MPAPACECQEEVASHAYGNHFGLGLFLLYEQHLVSSSRTPPDRLLHKTILGKEYIPRLPKLKLITPNMPSKRRPSPEEEEEEEEEEAESIPFPPPPTQINPYKTLSLPTTATPQEIKSAYRHAALQTHPDKAPPGPQSKEEAHAKFQEVAFAYAILSDTRRRSRYDATGRTEESLSLDDEDGEAGFDWTSFFRRQFEDVVTTEAIQRFEGEYKGSAEERRDLLKAYVKWEGDMGRVYQDVMLSDVLEDDERFRGIIEGAIGVGEVEGYRLFTEESEKSKKARVVAARRRRERESREVEEAREEVERNGGKKGKKTGVGKEGAGEGDLAALIRQRQQGRKEEFFDRLEAKYAPKGKRGGSKRAMDEPPEEAFAQNAKKGRKGGK